MKTNVLSRNMLCHAVLPLLSAAIILSTSSGLAGPCGSSQPSTVSDTCGSAVPCQSYGQACTRIESDGQPLFCKYAANANCLTKDWWNQGGTLVWCTVYDSPSDYCSQTCACVGPSRHVQMTVYETTYSNCTGGS